MRNQDYSILIRELKAGKESAFDSLFRLFYQDLCRFACSFLNDPMMAEDVVQGIFEKIWTRKKFIDESQQLDHYLYVSVRNACYTFLKNKKEHVKLDEVDSRKTYTEEISSDSDGLQIIRRMIEELPFQCRVIFQLVVLEITSLPCSLARLLFKPAFFQPINCFSPFTFQYCVIFFC